MAKWLGVGLTAMLVAAVGVSQAEAQKEQKVKRDRNVILPDEIAEKSELTNAYDAVQRLRPQWLKSSRVKAGTGSGANASDPYSPEPLSASTKSGERSSTESESRVTGRGDTRERAPMLAVAYIDDVKQHELEEIRNIRVAEIAEIRFMGGTEATGRYGDGHLAGAILIKTNRGARP